MCLTSKCFSSGIPFRGGIEAKQPIKMPFISYYDHVRNLIFCHLKKKPKSPNATNHCICGKENLEHGLHVMGISHMTWGSPGKCLTATEIWMLPAPGWI